MSQDYESRLRVPVAGMPEKCLFTRTGMLVARGYCRVVIGGRGPYVEMNDWQIVMPNFHVPDDQKHRISNPGKYLYEEWRTNDEANVKLYYQKGRVDYADYVVGMWYASPFELYDESGTVLIEPLKKPVEPSLFD